MNLQNILAKIDGKIDGEISRLRQARALLVPLAEEDPRGPRSLKGTGNGQPTAATRKQAPKRQLTPEGKQRIRDAQKARWAAKNSGVEHTLTTEEVTVADPSAEVLAEV